MLCGCRILWAARAVVMTMSRSSLYVVMKTSTVASAGGAGAASRIFSFHTVMPNSITSIRLYVSATTRGTAIHHASQFSDAAQRQAT